MGCGVWEYVLPWREFGERVERFHSEEGLGWRELAYGFSVDQEEEEIVLARRVGCYNYRGGYREIVFGWGGLHP